MGASGMVQEKLLEGHPNPVTKDQTIIILNQMKYAICKIKIGLIKGTGFFCYLPYQNNTLIPVLITNYHIINDEIIEKNKVINVTLNDDKELKKIPVENDRNIYLNKTYDIAIIEIKKKDNINYFLDLDNNIFLDDSEILYEKESIYILQYPNGDKESVSYGLLKKIDDFDIIHWCSTSKGSSGSPILNLKDNKVIGVHKECDLYKNLNKGTFLKEPLKDFIKSINNQKIEFIKNTKSLEHSESYFSTENNELPKQDSTDKNISNEFNGQLQISELDLDIRALPKNQFLCPICFCRIPEILDENLDNGDLLLRCKFDGIISINIYEYCKKIKKPNIYSEPICHDCNREKENNKFKYCCECRFELCKHCANYKHAKHKCIEYQEKNNKCLDHSGNDFTFFCKDCDKNICQVCSDKYHDGHEKKKLDDLLNIKEYIEAIKSKNKMLCNIIKFNEIILSTFNCFQKNYFHIKSIINLGNSKIEAYNKKEKEAIQLLHKYSINLNGEERYLNFYNKNLGDKGFKLISKINFKNLIKIDFSGNACKNLFYLSKMNLPYLEYIDFSENEIEDICPIASLKSDKLKTIILFKNRIKNIESLLISYFPDLEYIDLRDNNIENISERLEEKYGTKLIYLKTTIKNFNNKYKCNIYIKEKKVKYIPEINLSEKADENILEDLFLSIPPKSIIKKIKLVNCKIKDISILSRLQLDYLEVLNLSWNSITNLKFLERQTMKRLKIINLDFNRINDLTPLIKIIKFNLAEFPNLKIISLSNNNINYEDREFLELKEMLNKHSIILELNIDNQILKQIKEKVFTLDYYL